MASFLRKLFGGFSASKINDEFDKDSPSTQYSRCKYCGQRIVWKTLKTGQRWPLNTYKSHCVDDDGNVFLAYLPHFETCKKWRKKNK